MASIQSTARPASRARRPIASSFIRAASRKATVAAASSRPARACSPAPAGTRTADRPSGGSIEAEFGPKIAGEASTPPPPRRQRAMTRRRSHRWAAIARGVAEMWHQRRGAQRQQIACSIAPSASGVARPQRGALEGLRPHWDREWTRRSPRAGIPLKPANSRRLSLAHRLGELAMMVGEDRGTARATALSSPMKISGICGHSSCRAMAASQRLGIGTFGQAVAERPVADLIVVLQEQHERGGRQVARSGEPRGSPLR